MTSNFRVDMFELKNHALKLVRTQKTSQVWAALLQKNKVRIHGFYKTSTSMLCTFFCVKFIYSDKGAFKYDIRCFG